MTPEEEDYQEALRRIQEAERTGELDLTHLSNLTRLPPELKRLTSLKTLNLSECHQLSGDLRPLAGLTSLQTLNLSECWQLSGDLSPLAGLTSLRSLDLTGCKQLSEFAHLEVLLPMLRQLQLFGCNLKDLPSEVCGEFDGENVLDKVRAHYEDLKSGRRLDAEVKVFFLGNGQTGKTQLCLRLRGKPFDPSMPSTHGIQLSNSTITLEGFDNPVRLNFWDFGGQEIYHGSHALFLQGQAIFLLLWTPMHEGGTDSEGNRRRPLNYWLDYLRAFAGTDASVLIVQSQCDTARDRVAHPPAKVDDFCFLRWR
jgi:internalin A